MKLKALPLALIVAAMSLSACGGGGGGSTKPPVAPPTTPGTPNGPTSESIADLAAYASTGTQIVNERGVAVASKEYTRENGNDRAVRLAGNQNVGLLSTQDENTLATQTHTLLGADTNRNVNFAGHYVGDASGTLRMRNGEAMSEVRGTATVSMDASSGQWDFGSDLWRADGTSGAYIGIDDGTVKGNTMVFDPAKSVVVEVAPGGTTLLGDRAGAEAVFSNDGKNVFGTIKGSNAGTGFDVNAGFAGSAYESVAK